VTFTTLLAYSLFASLGEEILFRGFLFGHLYKHAKWGIVAAEFIEALVFGLLHLNQKHHSLGEAFGIFAIIFSGGLWFAWLYTEWNYNLWVPIFLHFLMNATWTLFDVSGNALGGIIANILRLLIVFLSIYLTVKIARKKYKTAIRTQNLFYNKN